MKKHLIVNTILLLLLHHILCLIILRVLGDQILYLYRRYTNPISTILIGAGIYGCLSIRYQLKLLNDRLKELDKIKQ